MIRIGQLTDIHVAEFSDLRRRDFFGKRGTGWFNYRRSRASEYDDRVLGACVGALIDAAPDLVIVSGDLSNLGLRSEWRAARAVLQPLDDAGIRVSVIPGNHDVYVRAALDGGFEEIYADWLVADARGTDVYPYVVRHDDVAVLHLNSGIPTPPLLAFGKVGHRQLDVARTLGRAERQAGRTVVVALHHHPTRAPHKEREWPRGLHDAPAVRALARELEASVMLHGHNHYFHTRRMRGSRGTFIVGCSSSTTSRGGPEPRRGQALLYTVDADGLQRLESCWWANGSLGAWTDVPLDGIPEETAHEALDGSR